MPIHIEVQRQSPYRLATLLLKAEKSNKLSTNFHPSPFKLVQKTGTKVTVRKEAGKEFRRNTTFAKKYNKQDSVSRPSGKEISSPEEVGQRENVVTPTMTGVSRHSPVPLQSSPEKGGEPERQQVR